MLYSIYRVKRTEDFEQWILNIPNSHLIDHVLIYFSDKINHVYVFTTIDDISRNEEYIASITNLVHNMPIEFTIEFIRVNVDNLGQYDAYDKIDNEVESFIKSH